MKRPREDGEERSPDLSYQLDPIRESLDVLGRKWTFIILRDIAFLKLRRFGQIKRNNPGLTSRVLSRRLKEMKDEGLLTKERDGEHVQYRLTTKGEDAVYILLALLRYGVRYHTKSKEPVDEAKAIKRLKYELPF